MKRVLLFLFLGSLVQARVTQELTISFGYHQKESLSIRSYQLGASKGFTLVKALEGQEVRIKRLTEKEYLNKKRKMEKLVQEISQKNSLDPASCFENFEIRQGSSRKPASQSRYCWDQLPKKTKTKFVKFWKSNTLLSSDETK